MGIGGCGGTEIKGKKGEKVGRFEMGEGEWVPKTTLSLSLTGF